MCRMKVNMNLRATPLMAERVLTGNLNAIKDRAGNYYAPECSINVTVATNQMVVTVTDDCGNVLMETETVRIDLDPAAEIFEVKIDCAPMISVVMA